MDVNVDSIVIGGGAAGLLAAIFAARTTNRVLLLERNPQTGRKILMSGGTRCNILPETVDTGDFVTSSSKHILRNILKSWSLDDCKEWFESTAGIPLSLEAETGKWFPQSDSSKEVRDRLLGLAEKQGVVIHYNTCITHMSQDVGGWVLQDSNHKIYKTRKAIMATGGLSYPKTGTDGTGHRMLKSIGHTITPLYPALTPLKGPHPSDTELSGISLMVTMETANTHGLPFIHSSRKKKHQKGFLFTHKGYSGPAVLDASHGVVLAYMNKNPSLHSPRLLINWINQSEEWWLQHLKGPHKTTGLLQTYLPKRLARAILDQNGLGGKKTAELSKEQRMKLIKDLTSYPLQPTGYAGFEKAEVTGGGVPLEQIRPATMESRHHAGLYLSGEVLDVFGRIGGFNFYWAWVTGRLAGLNQ